MKKINKLTELKVGQSAYFEDDQKEHRIKSLEEKLVPYVVTDDGSCHCLHRGIWVKEN